MSREQRISIGVGVVALLVGCCACIAAWLVVPIPNSLNPFSYGTQGSPENVARAWMKAVVAGDCATAKGLLVPGTWESFALERCSSNNPAHPKSARIDNVVVRNYDSHTEVHLIGEFPADMSSSNNWGNWNVNVEEVDGKWYVTNDVGPY